MTPIRPNLPPAAPPVQGAKPAEARLAAQKAFFEIAAGRTPAPAAAAPSPAPAATPLRAASQAATAAAPAPERPAQPLRPGSLLDIRV